MVSFLVPFAIFSAFFNIWDFNDRYIIKGEMDRILTRPIHSLFQIILERMELESLIGAITGMIVMGYAAVELQLSFLLVRYLLILVDGRRGRTCIRRGYLLRLQALVFGRTRKVRLCR